MSGTDVTFTSLTTKALYVYTVVNAPPLKRSWGNIEILPDTLHVHMHNGELSYVDVVGPRARKDGSPGVARTNIHLYKSERHLWPAWVVTAVDEMQDGGL